MWAELVEWAKRNMLIGGSELAGEADLNIPSCVNTVEETVALVRENYGAWLAAQSGS
jgi:hypothetical protein